SSVGSTRSSPWPNPRPMFTASLRYQETSHAQAHDPATSVPHVSGRDGRRALAATLALGQPEVAHLEVRGSALHVAAHRTVGAQHVDGCASERGPHQHQLLRVLAHSRRLPPAGSSSLVRITSLVGTR